MKNPGKGPPIGETDDEEPEVRALVDAAVGTLGPLHGLFLLLGSHQEACRRRKMAQGREAWQGWIQTFTRERVVAERQRPWALTQLPFCPATPCHPSADQIYPPGQLTGGPRHRLLS